jgi:glyoxylase-like metal-dependent hydrolase (beta-lactamase superfamily II)
MCRTCSASTLALWVKGLDDVRTYRADEQLDVPGRPRVVFAPGHTHGHCSLWFSDRGAVIAGDALVTLNPYTGVEGPRSWPAPRPPTACARWLRWMRLGAECVLCGHGPAWTQGTGLAVERARAAGPS